MEMLLPSDLRVSSASPKWTRSLLFLVLSLVEYVLIKCATHSRLLRPVCLINADGVDRKASGISVTNTYPAPFTQDLPEGRLARPHCSICSLCSVPTHFLNIYYCYCCYWTQNLTTHSSKFAKYESVKMTMIHTPPPLPPLYFLILALFPFKFNTYIPILPPQPWKKKKSKFLFPLSGSL